jgi:hypothetical protein
MLTATSPAVMHCTPSGQRESDTTRSNPTTSVVPRTAACSPTLSVKGSPEWTMTRSDASMIAGASAINSMHARV